MSKMTKAKKRRAADAREALIKAALYVLRGHGVPLWCDEIVALMARYDQGPTTARRLSAALRVARKDGRVTYDGKRYGLPAKVKEEPVPAIHAWVRAGQPVTERGGRLRSGVLRWSSGDVWIVDTAVAADGFSGTSADIIERWKPAVGEWHVAPPVPAWVQQDAAVLGIGEQEGKAGRLRRIGAGQWSVVDARGAPIWIGNPEFIAARWEPVGETHPAPAPGAARDLAERQAFGGAGIRTPSLTPQDVAAAGARAPVPTEAAERIAALEARAAKYAATIVELTMRLIASEKARAA